MDYVTVCCINPRWFDWGMFKPFGELIFFATAVLYLGCFLSSIKLTWRIAQQVGYPTVTMIVGLFGMVPMVVKAVESLGLQMTSAHYQEQTHIFAIITMATSIGILTLVSLILETWRRPIRRCTRPPQRTR